MTAVTGFQPEALSTMRAKCIKTAFHWAGIALATFSVIGLGWNVTAALVYGVMWGIGWLMARLAGDREQISN
jgi:hypothetical protein